MGLLWNRVLKGICGSEGKEMIGGRGGDCIMRSCMIRTVQEITMG